ncbi:heavy metal sensor histidine kinase [Pseudomonas panipatensis]|uniref:heavy metal sensor histidine kinase n=1 Tax=Pseudomonas panipatensis TaxID=428992 RepID=UPI0035B4EE24
MKPASLSSRLGIAVSLLCTSLVVVLALLAYAALSHELETRAHSAMADKLRQVRHSLVEGFDSSTLAWQPHSLLDLVLGHDNLSLTVLPLAKGETPLLDTSTGANNEALDGLQVGSGLSYHEWNAPGGARLLIVGTRAELKDGTPVRILLSLDRSADASLLEAFRHLVLTSVPFLLLLVGLGAWYIVQRGLSPLRHFRKVASRVSTEDLSHRIPLERLPLELREAAHALNVMLHRLDSGVQQLTQFSDDLAHELRSPISNLLGKAQVTLSRERACEEYKAVLASSVEELSRVTRIVSDMLFLAQVSQPQAQAGFKRVALDEEAYKVAELFLLPAEEKQVDIEITGEGWVMGDRLMIQRAISNLLSNAIRHSPPGSLVSIRIDADDAQVRLCVGNPGPGIAQQHLPMLFERFYRVDSSRSRAEGGTGLGLAIVRSIMSLHRGTVAVESSASGPTLFLLRFPLPRA